MKGLVGLSPTGALGFLSELYTGSISDKELTKMSNVIDCLDPGDDVMADKGFDIQDDFAAKRKHTLISQRKNSVQQRRNGAQQENC